MAGATAPACGHAAAAFAGVGVVCAEKIAFEFSIQGSYYVFHISCFNFKSVQYFALYGHKIKAANSIKYLATFAYKYYQ